MLLRKSLICLLVAALLSGLPVVTAQDGTASARDDLRLLTGPGTRYTLITVLAGGTPMVLEARSRDRLWVLVHTLDSAYRGWVDALNVVYPPGTSAAALPASREIVSGAPALPDAVSAYTTEVMNVRSGPGTNYRRIDTVPAETGLVLEARNSDASWVLAHTPNNAVRGWLSASYVRFSALSAGSLPLSRETIAAPPTPTETNSGVSPSAYAGFDLARVQAINLSAYPVIGRATSTARNIFLRGQAAGRDPHHFSKIGDCFSEHEYFLKHFSWDKYDLGDYSNLQGVIDHFKKSFDDYSYGASTGFIAGAVLDPQWADPGVCQPDESPLSCEYRVHNASAAVIMFGTQDVLLMTPEQFDEYLREVVRLTIEDNVIPILSTFPGNTDEWEKTILYNQIVVQVALDYQVPLMNLWLALEALPNHGLDSSGNHLSMPITTPGDMSYPNLDYGYPLRNLVVMQTLDAVWRGAMQ